MRAGRASQPGLRKEWWAQQPRVPAPTGPSPPAIPTPVPVPSQWNTLHCAEQRQGHPNPWQSPGDRRREQRWFTWIGTGKEQEFCLLVVSLKHDGRNGGMSLTRNEGQDLKDNLGCRLCNYTVSGLTRIHQFGLKLFLNNLQPQNY